MSSLTTYNNSSRSGRATVLVLLSLTLMLGLAFALVSPRRLPTSSTFRSIHSSTKLAMSKKVLVPIGEGSEEIETTCITDTLTRFGADVTIASVMKGELVCKMSRGIKVCFLEIL